MFLEFYQALSFYSRKIIVSALIQHVYLFIYYIFVCAETSRLLTRR